MSISSNANWFARVELEQMQVFDRRLDKDVFRNKKVYRSELVVTHNCVCLSSQQTSFVRTFDHSRKIFTDSTKVLYRCQVKNLHLFEIETNWHLKKCSFETSNSIAMVNAQLSSKLYCLRTKNRYFWDASIYAKQCDAQEFCLTERCWTWPSFAIRLYTQTLKEEIVFLKLRDNIEVFLTRGVCYKYFLQRNSSMHKCFSSRSARTCAVLFKRRACHAVQARDFATVTRRMYWAS